MRDSTVLQLAGDDLLQTANPSLIFTTLAFCWKKILGDRSKENNQLFFKTIDYCFHCSFYCFSKSLAGNSVLGQDKSRLEESTPPCPHSGKKPAVSHSIFKNIF